MARRERLESEPPSSSSDGAPREPRDGDPRRSRLESVIPDLIKKAVHEGYDRASGRADSIRSFISESKLPKELAQAMLGQLDETKNGLFRVVAKEVRGFLEAIDFQRELQKLLTTVSFEIKTEIRFIPNDSQPERLGRPSVKADMKVKRSDRAEGRAEGREGRSENREGKRTRRTDRGSNAQTAPEPNAGPVDDPGDDPLDDPMPPPNDEP